VAPDGTSLLVTRGVLNLTHRDSHEFPEPLERGRRYSVTLRLNAMAHSLPAGHRWRVAISPDYWYHVWPSPEPVTLTVFTGESRLVLPVRAARADDQALRPLGPAEGAAPLPTRVLRPGSSSLEVKRDVISGRVTLSNRSDEGALLQTANGIVCEAGGLEEYSLVEGQPLSAMVRSEHSIVIRQADDSWRTRVETRSSMSADARHFHLTNVLEAFEGEARVFARTWHRSIPRDLV
jgi:hypothetical protein